MRSQRLAWRGIAQLRRPPDAGGQEAVADQDRCERHACAAGQRPVAAVELVCLPPVKSTLRPPTPDADWLSYGSTRARPRSVLGRRRPEARPGSDRALHRHRDQARRLQPGLHGQGPGERKWSAKFPPEAPTEVVASRILWGIGYHQPPIYYVGEWNADKAHVARIRSCRRGSARRSRTCTASTAKGAWSVLPQPVRRHAAR